MADPELTFETTQAGVICLSERSIMLGNGKRGEKKSIAMSVVERDRSD